MKTMRILIALAIILISAGASGQKIKVLSGNAKALEGVTKLNIEYDYSDLGVGDYEVEQEYIDHKVADMNKKEAGSGERWKEAWFNDRSTRYEPKFEELFTKYAPFFESGQDLDADVTMVVHTTFIEPGFNVGVARRPALINVDVKFLKGSDLLLELEILKSPGTGGAGYDFDTGWRISEAYAKAAKTLARYLDKELH